MLTPTSPACSSAQWDNCGHEHHTEDPEDIERMRIAGRFASDVLDYITPTSSPASPPSRSTICAPSMAEQGTKTACLGYQPPGMTPYPAYVCTSVNHVVCHGIPNDKPLKKGDIVNVDVTIITEDGWFGDNSRMFIIGEGTIAAKRLSKLTFEAMWKGIAQVKPGATLGDIGHAIQTYAESNNLSVVREYCGHGIGKVFHDEPQVLHYGRPGEGVVLEGHGLHHRAHAESGQARHQGHARRLDRRHQGPQPDRPVGADAGRHQDRL
jgi:methionyl aminopeptidase